MSTAQTWKAELRPMAALATPIVVAEVGWMLMGIVDTMMVGRLPDSAAAIGAVSLGTVLFYMVGIFGSGLLLALEAGVPNYIDKQLAGAWGAGPAGVTARAAGAGSAP